MPSMSYCKFENTFNELDRCADALEEANCPADLDQSSYEDDAMHNMRQLCADYIREYDRLFPNR
jgi:hypothetical protein